MLYSVVQTIRQKIPFVWNFIEYLNEFLFWIRYKNAFKSIATCPCPEINGISYRLLLDTAEINVLKSFFDSQPEDAFKYFHPHDFDEKSLNKLLKSHSFIILGAFEDDRLVGYSFLRSFFNGKAFRGKMVDNSYRGKGIAKNMCLLLTELCAKVGLRQFGTISRTNLASMNSSKAVNQIVVIDDSNDDVLIEYLPLGTSKYIY